MTTRITLTLESASNALREKQGKWEEWCWVYVQCCTGYTSNRTMLGQACTKKEFLIQSKARFCLVTPYTVDRMTTRQHQLGWTVLSYGDVVNKRTSSKTRAGSWYCTVIMREDHWAMQFYVNIHNTDEMDKLIARQIPVNKIDEWRINEQVIE